MKVFGTHIEFLFYNFLWIVLKGGGSLPYPPPWIPPPPAGVFQSILRHLAGGPVKPRRNENLFAVKQPGKKAKLKPFRSSFPSL